MKESIRVINIQDTAHAVDAIKRMLDIVNISDKLKQELLDEADNIEDRTLYITKIYQESMKSFVKLDLTEAQITYLDSMWNDIAEESSVEYDTEGENHIEYDRENENHIEDDADKQNGEAEETNTKSADPFDRVDELVEEALRNERKNFLFTKGTVQYGYVKLPEDFDNFIRFMAPMIGKPGMIDLDFADIVAVTGLDIETKGNKDEKIYVAEICGNMDFCREELRRLPQKEIIISCLMYITLGLEGGLAEFWELANVVSEISPDLNLIYGLSIEEEYDDDRIRVQLVVNYQNTEQNIEEQESKEVENNEEVPKGENSEGFKIDMTNDMFGDVFKGIFGEDFEYTTSNRTSKKVNQKESKDPIKVPSFVLNNNRKNKRANNIYSDDIE